MICCWRWVEYNEGAMISDMLLAVGQYNEGAMISDMLLAVGGV